MDMPLRHHSARTPSIPAPHADAPATARLHGRENACARVSRLLAAARSGRGGVLLVEGPPGAGRSSLLANTAGAAARCGVATAHGAADEVRQAVPLAPLVAALSGGGSPAPLAGGSGATDPATLIDRLGACLAERLHSGPVAVVLDDLHWADPVTLAALGTLVTRFADESAIWVLARCTGKGGPAVDRLFSMLREAESAEFVMLEPLPESAVVALAADRLGAEPDAALLAYAEGADGNPGALVALLDGLVEEGRVRVADGKARLADDTADGRPPRRFSALVSRRVGTLRPETRLLLRVAAVLGHQSAPDDMSHILGEPTAAVLPALQEALESRIVACEGDRIAFRRDLVRQALLATIPGPMRGALHRQAADMFLGREGGVLPAAAHLVHGARHGDVRDVEVLHAAAFAVAAAEPRTAAELAQRALEITGPANPARPDLVRIAIEALTRSGPLPQAIALARKTLAHPLPPRYAATVRCWLSPALLLAGRPAKAVAEAEAVTSRHGVPAEDGVPARDHREAAVLNRLASLAELDVVAASRESRDEARRRGGHTSAGLLCVLAKTHWREGRIGEGLSAARAAVELAGRNEPAGLWGVPPHLVLATMLTQLRQTTEATAAVDMLAAEIETGGWPVLRGAPLLLGASLELTCGALDAAVAKAADGLAAAEEAGVPRYAMLGLRVLADVALRRGDLTAADDHVRRMAKSAADGPAAGDEARALAAHTGWLAAQLAAARGDRAALVAALATVHHDGRALRRLLAEEPTAAAWLVRAALDAGEQPLAAETAHIAERLAADNTDVPSVLVAEAHARGLHKRDPGALRRAADQHQDPWARASASEDLAGIAGIERKAAVDELERAMAEYARLGAQRDEARVRRRLRRLGVRRRHWTLTDRPTSGWASLTDTEHRVADLVAQGLTNRQAAAQMFLSPHTIGFHLRQIFRKLGIQSRIELVRMHADTADRRRVVA